MNKQEFLSRLREGLLGLQKEEIAERLSFYGEMIDDRVEEGLSEEAAVAEIGSLDNVIKQIIEETPATKPAKEKIRQKRRLRPWEIILLILGSPLWLTLLLAAFAVVLAVFITLWAVILSLWVTELSFVAGALGGVAAGVLFLTGKGGIRELLLSGVGLVLAGLSVFLFFGCKAATKGAFILTKKITLEIKSLLTGRRAQDETVN